MSRPMPPGTARFAVTFVTCSPSPIPASLSERTGVDMQLRKGMKVRELTKKVGQVARRGRVKAVRGRSVEVEWEDGTISSVSGGFLFPVKEPGTQG